jgi:hypothetical protein
MPEIAIDNSFMTERARDYAALSDLAYTDWSYNGTEWVPEPEYQGLWDKMKDKGYTVLIHKPNDSVTGYSGTLFEGPPDSNGIKRRILANRGTSLSDAQDLKAALQLSRGEMPTAQFCAMDKFIEELQTNKNILLNEFDVTGHSLGGTLAQMAKATWQQFVDVAYTYNAPGAKNLTQNYIKLSDSVNAGYVIVQYRTDPSMPSSWEEEWAVSTWNSYERYLAFRGSVDGSKVFNISGKDFPSPAAKLMTDIGLEVFTDGSLHFIESVRNNMLTSPFYVDARNDFTIIGSDKIEAFVGGNKRQNNDGDPVGKLTFVGGCGSDRLQGWNGDDTLYGDLPAELNIEDIKKITGNVSGKDGNDVLTGGAGTDRLIGGGGDDTSERVRS